MKKKRIMALVLACLVLGMSSGCGRRLQTQDLPSDATEVATEEITTETMTTEVTTEAPTTERPVTTDAPLTTEVTTEVEAQALSGLESAICDTIASDGFDHSNVSVFYKNVDDGSYVNLDGGKQKAASLIKLYVAGAVYEANAAGTLRSAYDGELTELIRKMITVSDNDACNTLVKKLGGGDATSGMAAVNDYCIEHAFSETSMGRLMLDFSSGRENYTSVSDCARFLRLCLSDELAGADEILGFMKQQERVSKIPAGVPQGVSTANKTGELDDTENDVAVIYADDATYILCVMVTPTGTVAKAQGLITDISKTVYNQR